MEELVVIELVPDELGVVDVTAVDEVDDVDDVDEVPVVELSVV